MIVENEWERVVQKAHDQEKFLNSQLIAFGGAFNQIFYYLKRDKTSLTSAEDIKTLAIHAIADKLQTKPHDRDL